MEYGNLTEVELFIKAFDAAKVKHIFHDESASSQIMGHLLNVACAFNCGDFSLYFDHSPRIQKEFIERLRCYFDSLRVLAGEGMNDGLHRTFREGMEFLQGVGKSPEVRMILREHHGMLMFITKHLDPELPPMDRVVILKAIEVFTQAMMVNFKSPHLAILIKKVMLCFWKEDDCSLDSLEYPIKILLNLCCESICCVLMVKEEEQCKHLLRSFPMMAEKKGLDSDTSRGNRIQATFTHLQFLLDIERPLSGVLNAAVCFGVRTFTDMLEDRWKYLSDLNADLSQNSLLTTIPELSSMFRTLIRKADSALTEKSSGSGPLMRTGVKLSSMLSEISLYLGKAEREGKLYIDDVKALLELALVLYESFLAKVLTFKDHQFGVNIATYAMKFGQQEAYLSREALKLYHIIAESIRTTDAKQEWLTKPTKMDEHVLAQIEEGFKGILDVLILSDSTKPSYVAQNIMYTRFLSRLCGFPGIREIIVSKLDYALIRKFTEDILNSKTDGLTDVDALNQSICIVEFLGLLAELPNRESIDTFMNLASKPNIAEHIASCIYHGDEKVIGTALQVIGSVPYDRKNLPMITNSLVMLKRGFSQYAYSYYPNQDMMAFTYYDAQNMGPMLNMVEESLSLQTNAEEGPSEGKSEVKCQMSDLVSWHKMRMDVVESEVKNTKEQLEFYRKKSDDLKELLDHQTELLSKRAFLEEKGMLDVATLQRRLEKANQDYAAEMGTRAKEVERIRDAYQIAKAQVKKLEDDLKVSQEEIGNLNKLVEANTGTINDLKNKLNTAQEDKRSWRADAQRMKTELADLKSKMEKLGKDFMTKEVELANTKSLLEKEKKTLDTIRSVIGSNFGNFNI